MAYVHNNICIIYIKKSQSLHEREKKNSSKYHHLILDK